MFFNLYVKESLSPERLHVKQYIYKAVEDSSYFKNDEQLYVHVLPLGMEIIPRKNIIIEIIDGKKSSLLKYD